MSGQDRKAQVFERIAKREEARIAAKDQRRADLNLDIDERENNRRFYDEMRLGADELFIKLNDKALDTMSVSNQNVVFGEVVDGIDVLSRRLNESTMFLPSFDIEQSREVIQSLHSRLSEVRERVQPKKKFTFGAGRRKKNGPTVSAPPTTTPAPAAAVNGAKQNGDSHSAPAGVANTSGSKKAILGDYGVSERSDEPAEIVLGEAAGKDLFLSQLERCRVRLSGGGIAMRIDRLRECVVVCGPMSGSIFLDNCTDCVFVLACQQLRIHSTQRSAFYIHVTSKAIIEDSSELEFAPYLVEAGDGGASVEELFAATRLNFETNNWDKVDDFCHLAADVPSSNWRVMPEEKRRSWCL